MIPFLAVDWGTTNLRGWRVGRDGQVEAEAEFPLGVSRLGKQTAAECFATTLRPALGGETLPALLCGMIGSTLGWRTAPYVSCPSEAKDVFQRLLTVENQPAPVRIVPGLICDGPFGSPDVMRGEETQIFGWVAQDPARQHGAHLICHPGTHSKWARIRDGRITHFATAMTGELFDVLRRASIIGEGSIDDDEQEFARGLAAAGDGGALSARLFATRARIVAGEAEAARAPSFLSGLLIGSEIGALPGLMNAETDEMIHVIGSPMLGSRYGAAIRGAGWPVDINDGDRMVLAGLKLLVTLGALDDV